MTTLHQAERAATYARTCVDPLENLSDTALLLYQALRETARRTGAARGYVASTTQVTLHIPLEVVAEALGRHRVTVWRRLPELRAAGLVDARAHKCSSELGRSVNDGTLWCVRLNPDAGAPARLSYGDFKHPWRDLDRDRRRGRTAFRAVRERREKQVQQSNLLEGGFDLGLLMAWSLNPDTEQNPVTHDRCTGARRDLEAVLDVQHVAREDRNAAVDGAALALAGTLRDRGGLNFYRWLIWQLLRLQDRTGAAPWYAVYEQAQRARVDAAEGFARKPGALFVSRLKGAPWWGEVMRAPPLRVGGRPVEA